MIADLPDNVCSQGSGYVAASEGVMYSINAFANPPVAMDSTVVNSVLNPMARGFVGFRSGSWVSDGSGHSFELKLLRKEDFDGQHRKVYAYALVRCSERKDGVLIVHASKAFYYVIDISGANESDARVQRFLKSLKFK